MTNSEVSKLKTIFVFADTSKASMGFMGVTNAHYINYKDLSLLQVKRNIDKFLNLAVKHNDKTFKVFPFGEDVDIAPMFTFAPPNVLLPKRWQGFLPCMEGRQYWTP